MEWSDRFRTSHSFEDRRNLFLADETLSEVRTHQLKQVPAIFKAVAGAESIRSRWNGPVDSATSHSFEDRRNLF